MNHRAGLKTAILLPLALVLAALLGVFHYGLYQHEKTAADEDFALDVQSAQTYFQRALLRRSEKLGAALAVIMRDEPFQAALRARDRDALLKRAAPLFKDFHDQYGITHFYFEDAARVNVLRVHQPERHGDTIDRFTTLAAERTGIIASGVELGPLGTFTLRVVAPMHDSKGLVGYVELGEEIEEVLHGVQAIVGTDHLLAIDKQFLTRKAWEDTMRLLGRRADWAHLPDAVIAHQTLDLPAESVTRVLSREEKSNQDMDLVVGAKHYYAATIPLEDAGGRKVGKLVVLRDKTQNLAETKAMLRSLGLFYLVLGGALFAMFYFIIRQVQRHLDTSRELIVSQGQEREALQARHILELENERDKLQQAQKDLRLAGEVFENSIEGIIITDAKSNILRVNRAFTVITGYGEGDAVGVNPRLLRSDRHDADFYQEMWASLLEYGYWQGEIWNRRKNGEIYPQWLSIVAIRNEQGKLIHYLGVFADLTEKKQAEAHLHHLAYYDALTELPNRLLLEERMKQALATASHNNSLVAVLHLDLDRFKTINDTLGHPFGDKLLQAVAERLAGNIRDSDTIARFSGDEFALVLTDVGNQENAALVARKILDTLAETVSRWTGMRYSSRPASASLSIRIDAANMDDLTQKCRHGHESCQGPGRQRLPLL